MAGWVKAYKTKFGVTPDDYAVTAYDAATVIIDAIRESTKGGKAPTRAAVRDAIQSVKATTLQGPVAFDENGDLRDKTISVFQIKQNKDLPADDMEQYHYIGVAPAA
jgi:branched-chain amino acid transport system substrate-binding protein